VPLLINDRIDVALAVDAEGVHIGQDDMGTHTSLNENHLFLLTLAIRLLLHIRACHPFFSFRFA
jgi:hypothetical protein